jgi:hypothetical protein
MLKETEYHSDNYLLRSKIFLPHRHSVRKRKEEGQNAENTEKIKNIKYKLNYNTK